MYQGLGKVDDKGSVSMSYIKSKILFFKNKFNKFLIQITLVMLQLAPDLVKLFINTKVTE